MQRLTRLLVLSLLALQCNAVPITTFFSHGTSEGDMELPRGQATNSVLELTRRFSFSGTEFNSIYVSSDGVLSLGQAIPSRPEGFPTNQSLIAPFWTSYDYSQSGQVYYRESDNETDLSQASRLLGAAVGRTVTAESVVVVTWNEMVGIRAGNQTNTFQCVLVTSGQQSYVMIFYLTGGMQWTGSPLARVGVSSGSQVTTLPLSGTQEVLEIPASGNGGQEGHWLWKVDEQPQILGVIMGWDQAEYTVAEDQTLTACVSVQSGTLASRVVVTVAAQAGTAETSRDFSNIPYMLTFERSQASPECTPVYIRNDKVFEDEEQFSLSLQVRSDITLLPRRTTVRIQDDESVTVTHRNPVVEVDEGAGSVEVCGTLKNNAGSSVTTEKIIRVAYSTVPGTAIANEDYQPVTSGELVFARGSSEVCATITIEDDQVFENDKMFYISFSQESSQDRVRINDTMGTVTILDDDTSSVVISYDADSYTVTEGNSFTSCVSMTAGTLGGSFNLTFATRVPSEQIHGTRLGATPNTDFTLKQVEFTFDPSNVGESHCVTVQTLEDDYYEGEEIFGLGIFSDTPVTLEPQMEFGQPGPGLVTVYLQDNDEIEVNLLQQQFDFTEGQDRGTIKICANHTGQIQRMRTLIVAVTAELGNGTVTWYDPILQIGDVSRSIGSIFLNDPNREPCSTVTIRDDYVLEDTETFNVRLSHPDTRLIRIPVDTATVAIHDNDDVRIRFQREKVTPDTVDEADVAETPPKVCISLVGGHEIPVHFYIQPINGTATEHEDYEAEGLSIEVPTNTYEGTKRGCYDITIRLFDDPVVEGDEEMELELMSDDPERIIVVGSDGEPQRAALTIVDDDQVFIQFTNPNERMIVSEGQGSVEVCLLLRGYTTRSLAVNVYTRGVTAEENIDFVHQSVSIEFPATNQTVLSALYALNPQDRLTAALPTSDPLCARFSIIDDQVLEETREKLLTFILNEEDPKLQIESPSVLLVIIQDDDFVTIDIATNTTTVSEDVGVVTVCVQLTGSADTAIAAHLRTAHGSASAGDYETKDVSFHWVPRSTEPQCANFTITDDSVLENVEEFYVELSVPDDNPLIEPGANSTLTVIITDNDFVEVEFKERYYSRVEDQGSVEVCAHLTGRAEREVSATFSTRDSEEGPLAAADVDYTAVVNVTFFGTGLTTECVSIPLNDDEILEDTETFQVVMTSQDSGVHTTAHSVADVFILDNDGVRMGIQEREYEIGESQGTLSLCVELTGRIAKNVIVHLSTESDTATGGADFTSVRSQQITFQASQDDNQTLCSDFTIIDDTILEPTERFAIILAVGNGTTGVSIHIPMAIVDILDNDGVSVGFEASSYSVSEGAGHVEVCLVMDGRTETEVECTITTQPGTASLAEETGPADYTFTDPVSLLFPPSNGLGRQCTMVGIVNDQILEPVEQFELVAASDGPRVSVTQNTSTVTIIDNDSVSVGFVNLSFNVSEDVEIERSVSLCVGLTGEIEKNVSVTVATESSENPLAVATAGRDYVPLERELMYSPGGERTHCVVVVVLDDRLVEGEEQFDLVITSSTPEVNIPEATQRATVSIYDTDVVCETSETDTPRGFFNWPEAFPNEVVTRVCVNGTALRRCNSEGKWEPPEVDNCYASIDAIFIHILKNLPTEYGLSKEYLRELIKALRRLKEDNPEGLSRFIGPIYTIFEEYAKNVTKDVVQVDPEVYELILVVVDILHFPEWPKYIIQEESVRLVSAVEAITVGLIKIDGFEQIKLSNTFLGFSVEKGTVDQLLLRRSKKTVIFERHTDQGIVTKLSPGSDEGEGTFLSSIYLPDSISEQVTEENVGLYFAFYERSVLFPLANGTSVNGTTHAISPVVMATVSKTNIQNLKDTINYTISITGVNYTNPVCVSWDFRAVGGKGNWTTDGCKLVSDENGMVSCSCTHLTNFAVMLDVRVIPPTAPVVTARDPILSTILIVGVGISLLGLTLTVVTLLLFSNLRKRDSTVFRIQFCLAVALMLLAFVCGIERVEVFAFCVSISALIHYFTLVSMMWMAAEALLMFQKLIIATKTSVAYFIIASIICWLLPVPAVVVPIGIDRNFSIHQDYCFISHDVVFYAAFLGPIAAILVFNLIIFFLAFILILRYTSKQYSTTDKAKKRRAAIRTIFTILTVMLIFGLTWVFGAFTVLRTADYLDYLFVIFNSFQGLFIFLIFVVFAKETRDLWLQTCGCKKRKTDDGINELSSSRRVSRNPSLRKTDDDLDMDSEIDFSLEGADRLEALKAMDRDARLNMNSWDVMYIMPQNTFDIFLNSDQYQQPPSIPTAAATATASSSQQPSPTNTASPKLPSSANDISIKEDQSTADSGIMMEQLKNGRSPKRLVGEPITTIEESETKKSSHHIHSVSGIGYVSADSDDEFLDRTSPPVLATPPSRRRSRAYGDRFKREMQTRISSHEHDPEEGVVTSDFTIDVAQ